MSEHGFQRFSNVFQQFPGSSWAAFNSFQTVSMCLAALSRAEAISIRVQRSRSWLPNGPQLISIHLQVAHGRLSSFVKSVRAPAVRRGSSRQPREHGTQAIRVETCDGADAEGRRGARQFSSGCAIHKMKSSSAGVRGGPDKTRAGRDKQTDGENRSATRTCSAANRRGTATTR